MSNALSDDNVVEDLNTRTFRAGLYSGPAANVIIAAAYTASRFLTGGEIKLAQSFFGDSIDYAAVRMHNRRYAFFHRSGGMAPNGHIYLPDCYHHDFAKASIPEQRLFIHEMTHVWQHQNKVLHLAAAAAGLLLKHQFRYAKAYLFRLEAGKDLTDYGMEQQPAIIEEYFLRKHGLTWGDLSPRLRCLNKENDTQTLLEGVLENFLKDPFYARHKKLPRPLPS